MAPERVAGTVDVFLRMRAAWSQGGCLWKAPSFSPVVVLSREAKASHSKRRSGTRLVLIPAACPEWWPEAVRPQWAPPWAGLEARLLQAQVAQEALCIPVGEELGVSLFGEERKQAA